MTNPKDLYLENRRINQEEIEQRIIKLTSKPRRLMAILTGRCNISCIMCVKNRKENNFTLPKRVTKHIVGLFPYLESVAWQGGEVFLVDYFKELFQEAVHYPQLAQEINTNGLLFDEEWAALIEKANTKLIFSIDSTDKKTYEYIRRGARFENLIRNINLINGIKRTDENLKLEKIINVVIMRSNYKTLESFLDFALEYNFSRLNFLNMLDVYGNCPQENIFSPPDIEALDYLKNIFPSIVKRAESYGIGLSCNITPFLYDDCNLNNVPKSSNRNGLFCVMPWKSLCIDASRDGAVYPECLCCRAIGNICKGSVDEIWNSQEMQTYRNKIAAQDLENWCSPDCIKGLVNKKFLQAV